MTFRAKFYNESKYNTERKADNFAMLYKVESFEVVSGDRAEFVEKYFLPGSKDEYHEYLLIKFENGQTGVYCNTHVDIFRED